MTVWLRTRGLLSDRRSWDVVAVSRPSGSGGALPSWSPWAKPECRWMVLHVSVSASFVKTGGAPWREAALAPGWIHCPFLSHQDRPRVGLIKSWQCQSRQASWRPVVRPEGWNIAQRMGRGPELSGLSLEFRVWHRIGFWEIKDKHSIHTNLLAWLHCLSKKSHKFTDQDF